MSRRKSRPGIIASRAWMLGLGAMLLWSLGSQAATVSPCTLALTKPLLIRSSDKFGGLAFDSQCRYLYVTDATANQLLVVDLTTGTLAKPIAVGTAPWGLDFSPDGTTLYVANSTANSLSVVDVQKAVETSRISVPPNFANDSPFSVAVSATGNVFFSTTFSGSGFGGRMMEYEPATATLRQRTDFYIGGETTEATYLAASADRNTFGIIAADISSAPVFTYSATSDTFSHEHDLEGFISYVAVDGNGTTLLVDPNAYVLDGSLTLMGSLSNLGLGVAADPGGAVGYQVSGANVNVLNLEQIGVTKTLALGDTTNNGAFYNRVGALAISQDGALLAAITDNGVSIIPSGKVQLYPFASFEADARFDLESATGPGRFDLRGRFAFGARSPGLPPGSPALQLTVGRVALSLPAGMLNVSARGYFFDGQVNGGALRLSITRDGNGAYTFSALGTGFDLAGTTIPLHVAMTIGANGGRTKLAGGEGKFWTPASATSAAMAVAGTAVQRVGGSAAESLRDVGNFDQRGNRLQPASSTAMTCSYASDSVNAAPGAPGASCRSH